MPLRDFALMVLICAIWALNVVAAKVVVSGMDVPPLFFGALRSGVVALAVLPWLLPVPRPAWRAAAVGMLMGGGGFGLMFVGLRTASPSAASIVSQLGVPMATLLSIMMLGERVRWRRGLGIALAFFGVMVVMWDPDGFEVSAGLLFIAGGALAGALGTILMKQMEGISPLRYQVVAPLTLMSPLMAIGLGIWLTHDYFDLRMALGSGIALLGVLIIAVRPNLTVPRAILFRNRV